MSGHDIMTIALSGTALALSGWNLMRQRCARHELDALEARLLTHLERQATAPRRPIPVGVRGSEAFLTTAESMLSQTVETARLSREFSREREFHRECPQESKEPLDDHRPGSQSPYPRGREDA